MVAVVLLSKEVEFPGDRRIAAAPEDALLLVQSPFNVLD